MGKSRRSEICILLMICMILVIAGLSACTTQESSTSGEQKIKIGSGGVGGDFYAYGEALAKVLSSVDGIVAENSPTEGSVENLRLLHSGEIELALITSKFGGYAYEATEMFADEEPYLDLRTVANIFTFTNTTVTLKNSDLNKLTDILGKEEKIKIGVGPNPATSDPLYRPDFDAHGINWDKMERIYGDQDDLFKMLGDGSINAVCCGLGGLVPEAGLIELSANHEVKLLEYDPDLLEKAGIEANLIIAGSLPGAEKDIYGALLGKASLITSTSSMSSDDIYKIVEVFHNNLETLATLTPQAKESLLNESILASEVQLPFHDAAQKYWEETGVWKN